MKICLLLPRVFPGDRDYDTLEHPFLHNNTLNVICITMYMYNFLFVHDYARKHNSCCITLLITHNIWNKKNDDYVCPELYTSQQVTESGSFCPSLGPEALCSFLYWSREILPLSKNVFYSGCSLWKVRRGKRFAPSHAAGRQDPWVALPHSLPFYYASEGRFVPVFGIVLDPKRYQVS